MTYSGDDGSVNFLGLSNGKYTTSIEKPGYFPVPEHPADALTPVTIENAAADAGLGEIALVRKRLLSGSVRWSNGEAAARVLVRVFPVHFGRPDLRAKTELSATGTSESGEFRFEGLRPGRYIVQAAVMAMRGPTTAPMAALPVFYPNATSVENAGALDLRSLPEQTGVALTLAESRGVEVEGIIELAGGMSEGDPVMVGLLVQGDTGQPFQGFQGQAGKPFRFSGVPPGEYVLLAANPKNPQIRSFTRLRLGTENATGLKVAPIRTEPMRGKVLIEASGNEASGSSKKNETSSPEGTRIEAYCPAFGVIADMMAQAAASGDFSLQGSWPGETYRMKVTAPSGAYVISVTQGERSMKHEPYEFVAGGAPVEVHLKRDAGGITGTIVTSAPRAPATVVLAPHDRQAEGRYRATLSAKDGSFSFATVPPGDYDVFAFARLTEDEIDDAALERFASKSVKAAVGPNQTVAISVTSIADSK